jgi:hypothetical protein
MRSAAMRAVSFCSAIPALLRKMWVTLIGSCGRRVCETSVMSHKLGVIFRRGLGLGFGVFAAEAHVPPRAKIIDEAVF